MNGGANAKPESDAEAEPLPFVAPCRQLSPWAPFRWLRLGIADFRRAPRESLVYGAFMASMIALVSILAWIYGTVWFMFAMLGGFVFLAPLTCIGLYAISAQIERGQPVSMARALRASLRRHIGNELTFALVLLVIFLVWARAGAMVTVFFPVAPDPGARELAQFLGIGTAVGALFAAITFSASAFSLPMIMHRRVDAVTGVVTSINAVLRNKRAMIVWMTLIVLAVVLGAATAFVGLAFTLPVIGYAAWHGYLETIDASRFPRHDVGITAQPRPQP